METPDLNKTLVFVPTPSSVTLGEADIGLTIYFKKPYLPTNGGFVVNRFHESEFRTALAYSETFMVDARARSARIAKELAENERLLNPRRRP